ncbi:hypothetical protein GCM10028818_26760 [Spirosoma horti]
MYESPSDKKVYSDLAASGFMIMSGWVGRDVQASEKVRIATATRQVSAIFMSIMIFANPMGVY